MSMNVRYTLASKLAQFLRRNGDKVLNGSSKLSLTTSALCLLNSLFIDVLSHEFIVQNTNNSDCNITEIIANVQFLYDFMKKTSNLKLFHGMQTLRGGVDLSHFSNLMVLELRKIPAHLIIGLNNLSVQLRVLICTRSIYLLKEIFGGTTDDQNTTDIWTELKELNVSYNYLECLDQSLKSLPNLEILDLSHNNLKLTDQIEVLECLSFVNLSYNQLDSLPIFHSLSCRSIVKLYVRNNNLNDLGGLECLFNLEEFDAGYNLLSEYYVLNPLEKLKSLKMLNLEGNPLYFHSRHRTLLINYLHQHVKRRGLILNGKFLSVPGSASSYANELLNPTNVTNNFAGHQISINTMIGDAPNMSNIDELNNKSLDTLLEKPDGDDYDANSMSSFASDREISEANKVEVFSKGKKKTKKSKRKDKIHEVLIPDQTDESSVMPNSYGKNDEFSSHMETKNALETRRLERGKAWLIPDNPFQKTLTASLQVPANTPVVSTVANLELEKVNLEKELFQHFESQVSPIGSAVEKESLATTKMTEVLEIKSNNKVRHGSKESDDIEILSSTTKEDDVSEMHEISGGNNIYDYNVYQKDSNSDSDPNDSNFNDSESEEDPEDSIFHVESVKTSSKKESIFVNFGPKYIKERDAISGKTLEKLDLSSLKSVKDMSQVEDDKHELHLEFDTVKVSKQRRQYIFENAESTEQMMNILQPFADAHTLKEATCGALECVNCNSQFSKEVALLKVVKTKKPLMGKDILSSSYDSKKGYYQEVYACPNCKRHILVELDNIPVPFVTKASNQKFTEEHSDNISTRSASPRMQLFDYFTKISPILKRKTSLTLDNSQNTNVDNASTLGIQSLENSLSKKDVTEASMSRNSSDVTILSNPSQSSFAVIPEPTNENYLNTIVERDSQISLSPPISKTSTVLDESTNTQDDHSTLVDKSDSIKQLDQNECHSPCTEEKDFYSLTESLKAENTNNLPKSNDVHSSESEVYLSPNKSLHSLLPTIGASEPLELDESVQLFHTLNEKRAITYDIFRELDHRLKLYLEISILGEDEQFEACLLSSIVPLSTGEEFDGLLMLSSKQAYIIKFLPSYRSNLEKNEPLNKCVQVIHSSPLSHLRQIRRLLGNQGLIIKFDPGSRVFTLIIRDSDICNSFCAFLSDVLLEFFPEPDKVQFLSSSQEALKLLNDSVLSCAVTSNDPPEILLHLFGMLILNEVTCLVCIVVAQDIIFITKILYKKQDSCSDLSTLCVYHYADVNHQQISDLISLKVHSDYQTVEIHFLNESSHDDESICWTLQMQNKSALFSFISVVKGPWEEIFGVSLPLSLKED